MKTKSALKIGIILPTIISKNGTAKQSLELAKSLKKLGNEVYFYTYIYVSSTAFPGFNDFLVSSVVKENNSFFYKFIKNVSILETIYLYIALIFSFKFKSLLNQKDLDIFNPHDWSGIWIAALVGKKTPIIANINDVPQREVGLINRIKLLIDRAFAKQISCIVVLDNMNRKKVFKWLNSKTISVKVVRSGIDIGKYKNFNKKLNLRQKFGMPQESTLLVCANLLARNRRYEDAIHAMDSIQAKQKNIFLLILSKLDFDRGYARFLKELVRKKKLGANVIFIDKFFSDEERMAYLKSCDILIFPNYPQTWGLTVIEAMALGLPVVVSLGSGVSESLHHEKDSLLYKQGNISQLSFSITFLLQNEEKKKEIAKTGQKYVLSTFSWNQFGKDMELIMKTAIKSQC